MSTAALPPTRGNRDWPRTVMRPPGPGALSEGRGRCCAHVGLVWNSGEEMSEKVWLRLSFRQRHYLWGPHESALGTHPKAARLIGCKC